MRINFWILILFLGVFLGCGRKTTEPETIELRFGYLPSVTGLDPVIDCGFESSTIIMDFIYPPLFDSGDRASCILESVTSSDKINWTLTLKPDIRFQDDPCFPERRGRKLTPEDIRFALLRSDKNLIREDRELYDHIDSIRSLDDHSLEVRLHRALPYFASLLNSPRFRAVPQEALVRYGQDIRFHPVGCGPFILSLWEEREINLIKNPSYWRPSLPSIDRIVLVLQGNELAAYHEFIRGDLDLVPIPPQLMSSFIRYNSSIHDWDLLPLPEERSFHVETAQGINLVYCVMYFTNEKARKAFNLAVDREALVRNRPDLKPAFGPQFSQVKETGFSFSPAEAQNLVREKGAIKWPSSLLPLKFQVLPQYIGFAQSIKSDLERIGVDVEVIPTSWVGYQQRRTKHLDIGTFRFREIDPIVQVSPYQAPSFLFISPSMQNLQKLLRNAPSESDRRITLKAATRALMNDPPVIYLFWQKDIFLVRNGVENTDPDRYGLSVNLEVRR